MNQPVKQYFRDAAGVVHEITVRGLTRQAKAGNAKLAGYVPPAPPATPPEPEAPAGDA